MKRIAVPSDDGKHIAAHFGRCACFLVFEVEDDRVLKQEVRPNAQGGHQHGECHGSGPHEHRHGHRHGHDHENGHGHNHAVLGEILQDCETVLCRGMGWRAAEALKTFHITPLVIQTELPAQEAVEAYLAGSIAAGAHFCGCHH